MGEGERTKDVIDDNSKPSYITISKQTHLLLHTSHS